MLHRCEVGNVSNVTYSGAHGDATTVRLPLCFLGTVMGPMAFAVLDLELSEWLLVRSRSPNRVHQNTNMSISEGGAQAQGPRIQALRFLIRAKLSSMLGAITNSVSFSCWISKNIQTLATDSRVWFRLRGGARKSVFLRFTGYAFCESCACRDFDQMFLCSWSVLPLMTNWLSQIM